MHTLSSFNLYEEAISEQESFSYSQSTADDDLTSAIADPSTQVSVSRRTLAPGQVTTHAWFSASPLLTKNIWQMAITQHQFFLEWRSKKVGGRELVGGYTGIERDLCAEISVVLKIYL